MNRVLVTYATMAGSTREVAEVVGEEIAKSDIQVDVLPIEEVDLLQEYDGVVVGGPMIMGWHRAALGFLKKQRKVLGQIPWAVFVLAISLTETGETGLDGIPVTVDGNLPKPPKNAASLNFRESYAKLGRYLSPILKAARPARPVSMGVFGGRLEYGRLKWWAVLFVMLVIQAAAGDKRNWEAIRAWARELPASLGIKTG